MHEVTHVYHLTDDIGKTSLNYTRMYNIMFIMQDLTMRRTYVCNVYNVQMYIVSILQCTAYSHILVYHICNM